jgi:hypothetical protein
MKTPGNRKVPANMSSTDPDILGSLPAMGGKGVRNLLCPANGR